jgi:hypothetical protein
MENSGWQNLNLCHPLLVHVQAPTGGYGALVGATVGPAVAAGFG